MLRVRGRCWGEMGMLVDARGDKVRQPLLVKHAPTFIAELMTPVFGLREVLSSRRNRGSDHRDARLVTVRTLT